MSALSDVPVEVGEVVGGGEHGEGHNDHPHHLRHVTLDGSVEEDAVSDEVVVVEVASDDGGSQVDDHRGGMHHQNAENNTANVAVVVVGLVAGTEGVLKHG